MASASQTVLLAPTDCAALCARSVERTRLCGPETSVATSGMGKGGSLSGEGIIRNATLIAGPTASGKSAMALDIAEREDGIIVNADSMQVYSMLDLVTARPTAADQQRAPHALYGHVHPSVAYSTGAWLRDVSRIAGEGRLAGRRPDLRRRHRPLFPGAGRRHFQDAGDRGRCARPLAPATARQRAAGIAPHSAARRSRGSTSAEAGRRAAHRARAGGAGKLGPVDPRMAERRRRRRR